MLLRNKTILLVDDDERNIIALSATLRALEPIILTARDGEDCLKVLEKNPQVELILLDMMMPTMDGYQTLKFIRKNEKTKALPVIALTAQAMNGDREKCILAGANEYCSKPVNVSQLLIQIRNLLKLC